MLKNILANTIVSILIVFLISGICSCTTERKASNYMKEHPNVLAGLCMDQFPPKITQGKEIITHDTTLIKGDSIPCPEAKPGKDGKIQKVFVHCPDSKTIYINKTRVDTVENAAKIYALIEKLKTSDQEKAKLKAELEQTKQAEKDRTRQRNYMAFFLVISVLVTIRKLLLKAVTFPV